jgi:GTP cyclohydrolase I
VEAAERAVADLLRALGRDPESPQFALTPRRVVHNLRVLTTNETLELSRFENPGDYTEPIIMRDIPFVSLCEHHLLPFRGVAHVGYVPGDDIVGLSALAQVVEHYAANFQIQERLTAQIAVYLSDELGSRSVGVTIQAEHDCVATRGVRAAGANAVTQAFRGELADDPSFRALLGLASQSVPPQSVAPPARNTRRGAA